MDKKAFLKYLSALLLFGLNGIVASQIAMGSYEMKVVAKFFNELTTRELYEILKARAEIFVVEQNCVYQDLDDKDYESLHVFYEEDSKVAAYLRAFYEREGFRVCSDEFLEDGIPHVQMTLDL